MKTKIILVPGLAVVIGLALAGWVVFKQSSSEKNAQANTAHVVAPEPPKNPIPPAVAPTTAPDTSSPAPTDNLSESALEKPKRDAAQNLAPQAAPTKKPKEPLHDPDARAAMSLVGVDRDAEAYWLGAIFDSSLPDQEREDLMEDLNEEGLSDTKRPGPQDFPLIMNRLAIIEEIVPQADEFMLRHLGEAYKDLLNLADISRGGGRPVQ
ncbi:MAG: hypothetical protein EPO07_14640 [Verrucomicrobia bacterium]|nr:MAG: hypothetical protein EPO07_14640 [Verrucomicrobiota bacterium]